MPRSNPRKQLASRVLSYLNNAHCVLFSSIRYYFVEGHSLNDRPRLAAVVAKELEKISSEESNHHIVINAGKVPSEGEILDFLEGSEGRQEIENALSALNKLGVHGIPKFIIEGQTVVDGAAHSDVFVRIFREIEQAGTIAGGPVFGEILGVSPDIVARGSHHHSSPEVVA